MLPLLADHISHQWMEYPRKRRVVQRVPYLYTPSFIDPRYPHRQDKLHGWARELDINENYAFTGSERKQVTQALNYVMNRIHNALAINPEFLIWEQDVILQKSSKDYQQDAVYDAMYVDAQVVNEKSFIGNFKLDFLSYFVPLLKSLSDPIEF